MPSVEQLFKVQLAIETNEDEFKVLIYNEDRSIMLEYPACDLFLTNTLISKNKDFYWCIAEEDGLRFARQYSGKPPTW